MSVLFVSTSEPALFGPVSRLLYDILCAYEQSEKIDFAVVNKEVLKLELPENISFIPWHELLLDDKKNNPIFSMWKVRKDWTEYGKIHIDAKKYDCIISYPFLPVAFDYAGFNGRYETIAVDSATMVFGRACSHHTSKVMSTLSFIRFRQNARIDKICTEKSEHIYTVGESDAQAYNVFFNGKAKFIPHTVTDDVLPYLGKVKWKETDKLKICFAGSLSYFYTGDLYKELIAAMAKEKMQDEIEFYFLGKEFKHLDVLIKNGYEVHHDVFVPSYEEYLSEKHILLAPLLVGGGTKNRVLSAIAVGMDVIGTSVAMENIYGVRAENIANDSKQFIEQIQKRINKKKLYNYKREDIDLFLKYHDKQMWTNEFWNVI